MKTNKLNSVKLKNLKNKVQFKIAKYQFDYCLLNKIQFRKTYKTQ